MHGMQDIENVVRCILRQFLEKHHDQDSGHRAKHGKRGMVLELFCY